MSLLRRYRPEDEAQAMQVWLRASRIGHPFLGEEELARQAELVAKVYLPQAESWMLEGADGRIVGMLGLLQHEDGVWHIGGLFVDPDVHGQGLGRRMVDFARARKGTLTVDVYEANRAVTFYQALGFVLVARRETDDEGRPLPLLRMRLESRA